MSSKNDNDRRLLAKGEAVRHSELSYRAASKTEDDAPGGGSCSARRKTCGECCGDRANAGAAAGCHWKTGQPCAKRGELYAKTALSASETGLARPRFSERGGR